MRIKLKPVKKGTGKYSYQPKPTGKKGRNPRKWA